MSFPTLRCCVLGALLPALALLSSCSSEPAGPAPGTPAFFWKAAGDTYKTADYNKALENLDQVLSSDNDFVARAVPWALVLSSGMSSAYMELSDRFEAGWKANKTNPAALRRSISNYRGEVKRLSLEFAETAGKLDQVKGDSIPLAFGLPAGTAAPVAALSKVAMGVVLPAPELEAAQKQALERGVLLAACRMAGSPDDAATTAALLKTPDAKVARSAFLLAVAQTLVAESEYYGPQKLDDAEKAMLFCERAQNLLKNVPESKDTKDLAARIQKALKKKRT